jgi:hypothetical protein
MKTQKTFVIFTFLILSGKTLAYQQVQQESSVSSGGNISQTYPTSPVTTTSATTATAVKDSGVISATNVQVSNSNSQTSAASAPQLGVRDMKVTSDGKCKIGSISRTWAGSPCAKVYGPTAPTQATSSSSGASTSKGNSYVGSVYESSLQTPSSNESTALDAPVGMNQNYTSPE